MAVLLDQVVGHREQKVKLFSALAMGRLGSSLLFVGPSGIGKKKMALALVQSLVCQSPQVSEEEGRSLKLACGRCPACLRLENLQSESLLLVEPEGVQIKIDQSREVIKFLSLQILGSARVVLIDDVQKMNPQAANALLKVLEEPPENSYFILMAPSVSGLLSTIRSRCQVMRFGPLTREELKEVKPSDPWVIESAQGSVEFAELLQDSSVSDLREKSLSSWHKLLQEGPLSAFETVKDLVRDKKQSLLVARFWQQLLRDTCFFKEELGPAIHADHKQLLSELAQAPSSLLLDLGKGALQLEKDIGGNLDRGLSFENYLYHAANKLETL